MSPTITVLLSAWIVVLLSEVWFVVSKAVLVTVLLVRVRFGFRDAPEEEGLLGTESPDPV